MSQQTSDAAFFDMVHSLLEEQKDDSPRERRDNERHAYQCIQLLAPYNGKAMPAQVDFRKVTCEDLSSTGFSYFSARKPDTDQVVIALGAVPFMFYVAQVMHAHPVNNNGMVEYLVGCHLTNRVTRDGVEPRV